MSPSDAVDPTVFVPAPGDLPGVGWLAIDELTTGGGGGEAELIDCVGPDFPAPAETVDSASSPHFVRRNGQLVHGISVVFTSRDAAQRAAAVLRRAAFAECLGQAVVADLLAAPDDVEPLAVDARLEDWGQQLTFTGASAAGVVPIHLDLVVLEGSAAVVLVLLADTPAPFPPDQRTHLLDHLTARLGPS